MLTIAITSDIYTATHVAGERFAEIAALALLLVAAAIIIASALKVIKIIRNSNNNPR